MTDWNPDRNGQGRFQPGSGGRPPGARNRTGRKLREALERSLDLHFERALERVSYRDPGAFVRLLLQAFPVASDDGETPDDVPS